MQMLAHRGFWSAPSEKNSAQAFTRAFEKGYGVETDLRDAGGKIVISHDPPRGGEMTLDDFFALYRQFPQKSLLALNMKADGLAAMLREALLAHGIDNYFAFDMSIPDHRAYLDRDMRTYTRDSEFETHPAFLDRVDGVWMDCFVRPGVEPARVIAELNAGRKIAVVSPELHGRPYADYWKELHTALQESGISGSARESGLALCTDFPDQAQALFSAHERPRLRHERDQ